MAGFAERVVGKCACGEPARKRNPDDKVTLVCRRCYNHAYYVLHKERIIAQRHTPTAKRYYANYHQAYHKRKTQEAKAAKATKEARNVSTSNNRS